MIVTEIEIDTEMIAGTEIEDQEVDKKKYSNAFVF